MTDTEEAGRPWRRRARRLTTLWPTMAMGAVFWVLLWGDLSWANVLSGMALGVLVAIAFPLPRFDTATTLRPGSLLRLVGRFVSDLVLSSFQVAWSAITPGATPDGGLVSVQLRTASDLFISTTAGLSSMVPGTLVIDHDPASRTLTLHVLDLEWSGGADAVRESTLALEARVLRAFASRDELVRVGLVEPFGRPAPTSGKEVQR